MQVTEFEPAVDQCIEPNLGNFTQRVLVIEDDPDTRHNLCDILGFDGYQVTGVGSASEALLRQDLEQFTAIIVDRKLPDDTDDTLLSQLSERAPEVSCIVVTGDADLRGTISAMRQGASDYILKPINPDSLRASLARVNKLRDAQRRAKQAERLASIGQVVASVAHESRNALQRIQAHVDLMRSGVEHDPELLDDLQSIELANQSLRCLFEELREFSAPIHLDRELCSLRRVIQRAWSCLDVSHLNRNTMLKLDVPNKPCLVDPIRLEQVFRNLLENSIAAGRSDVMIQIASEEILYHGQSALRILFRDNGPGFNDLQSEKAFEPFFTTKTRGTGLGLPISRRIVEAHNGQMHIDLQYTVGAAIVIILPLVSTQAAPALQEAQTPLCQTV